MQCYSLGLTVLLSKYLLSLPHQDPSCAAPAGLKIHSLMAVLAKWLLWCREHEWKWQVPLPSRGLRAIGWFCHHCLPSARTGSDPNSSCSFGVPEWVGHQPGAGPSVHTSEKAACLFITDRDWGGEASANAAHLAKANIPPPVRNYSEYYMWLCIESAWKK